MQHPTWGSEVARQARLPETVVNVILHHHEQFNGEGYPLRLAGESIPLEARIATIADVFDAITSDRSYRKAHPIAEADLILREMTATHFDPELLKLFRTQVRPGIVRDYSLP